MVSCIRYSNVDVPTSNEIWSLPIRISSSCLPSLFFWGHFESSSLSICKPNRAWQRRGTYCRVLHDLAGLDHSSDLFDNCRADAHCCSKVSSRPGSSSLNGGGSYSLCGSSCRYDNWSCLHNGQRRCVHRRRRGSRTLGVKSDNAWTSILGTSGHT